MLESGTLRGWVVPMVRDEPRLNKPPLIYWLQAGSAAALSAVGENGAEGRMTGGIWRYRVPSVLCALAAVLATWRLGLSMFAPAGADGRRSVRGALGAWLGAAMLATSVMVLWDARQARADELLLAATTLAMAALWSCVRVPRPTLWRVFVLWLAVGAGVMSKGPVTPLVVVLAALAMALVLGARGGGGLAFLRGLRPLLGLVIVVAVALPWVALVGREVGWAEYWRIVLNETLGRSVNPAEGHWGPPGYHIVLMPVLFFPGSMLVFEGLVRGWREAPSKDEGASPPSGVVGKLRAWRAGVQRRGISPELFLLAWVIPAWVVFEVIGTKLPHYTLPLYPALALMAGRAVVAAEGWGHSRSGRPGAADRLGIAAWALIGVAVTAAAPMTLLGWAGFSGSPGVLLASGAVLGACGAAVCVAGRKLWIGVRARAQVWAIGASAVAAAVTFGVVLPALEAPWVSSRLARVIAGVDEKAQRPVGAVGFHEDSLVFLLGGRVTRLGRAQAEEWAAANPEGVLLLPTEKEGASGVIPQGWDAVGHVEGFNYSKGDRVELSVLRRVAEGTGIIRPSADEERP